MNDLRLAFCECEPYGLRVRKLLAAAGALLIAQHAAAQAPAGHHGLAPFELHVQKDELAARCPDEAWFAERVAAHTGGAATAGRFEIVLTKQDAAWHARIVRWEAPDAAPAERTLHDASAACEPLAEAVALTVALLADDAVARVEPPPPPIEPIEPIVVVEPPPVSTAAPQRDAPEARGVELWLGAGAGGAVAFIAPVAPLLGAGLALDAGHFRAGMRVMLATEQAFELEPGRVMVHGWLGTLLGCFASTPRTAGIALCAALDGGLLHGSATGFEREDPSTRLYAAAGVEAQPSLYLGRGLRLTAVLGAGLPLYRESFSVTGRGVAYRPPVVNLRALIAIEVALF